MNNPPFQLQQQQRRPSPSTRALQKLMGQCRNNPVSVSSNDAKIDGISFYSASYSLEELARCRSRIQSHRKSSSGVLRAPVSNKLPVDVDDDGSMPEFPSIEWTSTSSSEESPTKRMREVLTVIDDYTPTFQSLHKNSPPLKRRRVEGGGMVRSIALKVDLAKLEQESPKQASPPIVRKTSSSRIVSRPRMLEGSMQFLPRMYDGERRQSSGNPLFPLSSKLQTTSNQDDVNMKQMGLDLWMAPPTPATKPRKNRVTPATA